jgi:hypothetical protein
MGLDWTQWLSWLSFGSSRRAGAGPRRLELDLPAERKRPATGRGGAAKLEAPPASWRELNAHPIELLREIDRYLGRLNTEPVPAARRAEWVDRALQYACPAIRRIYSDEYKEDALPESHDRREGLVAAIKVCNQLATGFKHQLNLDFALPDGRYAKVRERVRLTALRILELIRMEQRLRAMRYQKLPTKVWLDCNRIFFALAQVEDVTEMRPALTCLQVKLDRKPGEVSRRPPPQTSIRQIYLVIQLYGLMDTNTISSRKMHLVDAHIGKVLDSLNIFPDDGSPLQPGELIIYSNQDGPAHFERQQEQTINQSGMRERVLGLKVDIVPLEAQLAAEHRRLLALFETDADGKPRVVTDQEDLARLLAVDVMCDRLRLKRRKDKREYVIGQSVLYVYNGFMSVYKLLVDMAVEDEDTRAELADDNELRDALAGRSALIAADVESSEFGQWFILDKSEGGVHVKTQESQFTTAMFIGQVLAFSYTREELQQPKLGYVVRLSRSTAGEIEVTIRILSSQAIATAVQSRFLSQNDMALPAMLLRDTEDGEVSERLVLHHSHRLSPGTPIQVELDGGQREYYITEQQEMQREFVVCRVQPGHAEAPLEA